MTAARRTSWLTLAAAALLASCADAPTSTSPDPSLHLIPIGTPEGEWVSLCKVGPVGEYTFSANASGAFLLNEATGAHNLSSATYTIDVTPGSTIDVGGATVSGACFSYTDLSGTHNHIALTGGGSIQSVTVQETGIPAGVAFVQAVVYQRVGATVTTSTTAVNSATGLVGGDGTGAPGLRGASIVFYNEAVPVYYGNSINVQRVAIAPTLDAGIVSSFTGSFLITAFDQPVTIIDLKFRISRNGDAYFWEGSCSTVPAVPFNVAKSSVVSVSITPACLVGVGPVFKKGDDVKLQVFATLATGRVFSNSGFYKIP